MSAAVMPPSQFPQRKPIVGRSAPHQPSLPPTAQYSQYPPDHRTYTSTSHMAPTALGAPAIPPMSADRASSMYSMQSHGYPAPMHHHQQQQQQQQQQYSASNSRRTFSNATSGSSQNSLQRASTGTSFTSNNIPRRSTSSRSNSSTASPTSYVALMRKQKGTVWCDRAQQEDPRVLAAQRAQKMRAAKEVAGSAHNGRVSMSGHSLGTGVAGAGGIRSKIRHHGAPKASTYAGGANLSGAGVPMRLSASEVDDDDSDDDDSKYMNYHTRGNGAAFGTGGSFGRDSRISATQLHGAYSNGSTPPVTGHSPGDENGVAPTSSYSDETPMPMHYDEQTGDYFGQRGGKGGSGGSAGAADDEEKFGDISGLPTGGRTWEEQQALRKTSEELRRRGSVDDRSMTMSGVRLFVANPDLSD